MSLKMEKSHALKWAHHPIVVTDMKFMRPRLALWPRLKTSQKRM